MKYVLSSTPTVFFKLHFVIFVLFQSMKSPEIVQFCKIKVNFCVQNLIIIVHVHNHYKILSMSLYKLAIFVAIFMYDIWQQQKYLFQANLAISSG